MEKSVNLTTRVRRRRLADGKTVLQTRYVLNYRDPINGQRKQSFFERKKDAEVQQRALIIALAEGSFVDKRSIPTVAEAAAHWLADREGKVKSSTHATYSQIVKLITKPVLVGSARERAEYALSKRKPKGARFIATLGHLHLDDLTTAAIRNWHRSVTSACGLYSANRAKSHLRSILALAEEDFRVRPPAMPTGLARSRGRVKKAILASADIARLIKAAESDLDHGPYYAFPFLAGTRPSEQLGLLWSDVDLDAGVIHIRRVQERNGTLTDLTKTEAGTRDIPMGQTLRAMLLAWCLRCPRQDGELRRVFPGPGRLQPWPLLRKGGGGPLLYQNFRRRFWEPAFKRLGLPYVTPHAARHSFISTMQAAGIEVGLVAKIAGHANPTVTLGHYTQAVRGGAAAVMALEQAYAAG